MDPFPEQWELISAFESEPEVLDAGVPWKYNSLRFSLERDGETLHCQIEPASREVRLRWLAGERQLMGIQLRSVTGIEVVKHADSEHLVISARTTRWLVRLAPSLRLTVTEGPD